MIFRRLALYNAGPFIEEWEVEFPASGVVAVVGEYEGEDGRSNRSGKSWFAVDAPLYALDGWTRGRPDDFPHRLARGQDDAWVEVEVTSSAGSKYVIRRGRRKNGDPIRLLDGANISDADLREVVETEIRGLTREEYLNTNAFVQGDMHGFMRKTAAEKRRLISPWFKTDRWIPRAELANARLGKAKSRLSYLARREEELENLDLRRAAADNRLADAKEARAGKARREKEARKKVAAFSAAEDARKDKLARIRDLRKRTGELESRVVEGRTEAGRRRARVEGRIRELERSLRVAENYEEEISQLQAEVAKLPDLRAEVAKLQARADDLQREYARTDRDRDRLKGELEALRRDRKGRCPVLNEACDRVELRPEDEQRIITAGRVARRTRDRAEEDRRVALEDKKRRRRDLDELETAEERLRVLREERGAAAIKKELETLEEDLEEALLSANDWEAGKTETQRTLRDLLSELERLEEETGESVAAEEARENLHAAEDALGAADDELAAARAEVERCKLEGKELREIRAERADVAADVERLAWTAYAFGATGIPSREMENAFGVAEDEMNRVLESSPLRVQFSPVRELKDWEPGCLACGTPFEKGERKHVCRECGTARRRRRRDELNLEVLDGENVSSFDVDSGAGKVLLSVGVRLGLASLPGRSRKVRCEHILIDEPDGALDAPFRADLYDLLRNRVPDLGIRQVILITHAEVREEFPNRIVVHRWGDEDRSAVWNE